MIRALILSLALLVTIPTVFASEVIPDGSAGGAMNPTEPALQSSSSEPKPELEPEVQSESAPELEPEQATTSAPLPVGPQPTPTQTPVAEPAPASTVVPSNTSEALADTTQTEATTPESEDVPNVVSPWMWLAGLLALAGGGIYGAYSLMKATQTNSAQTENPCEALKNSFEEKQFELSLAEHELSFHEEALKLLEEKANDKAESEKGKLIRKIENTAKDALLGKKGESQARSTFDGALKVKDTYEGLLKKIEKTKELIEMLRNARNGLSAEGKALESTYTACLAQFPEQAKSVLSGLTIVAPGNRPVRAIIFDWAGVLATEAYWIWVRKNVTDPTSLMNIDRKVDAGEMPHEEFVGLVAKISNKTPEEVWAGVKEEMVLNQELFAYIRELKKKYKIGLLSNFTAPWLREILDTNGLWNVFDAHIISSEHKLAKPDPKIFKKMLSLLDVEAGEVVFTDDRQINIDAAQKLGMRAFLFETFEGYVENLKSVNVSVKPKTETGSKGE